MQVTEQFWSDYSSLWNDDKQFEITAQDDPYPYDDWECPGYNTIEGNTGFAQDAQLNFEAGSGHTLSRGVSGTFPRLGLVICAVDDPAATYTDAPSGWTLVEDHTDASWRVVVFQKIWSSDPGDGSADSVTTVTWSSGGSPVALSRAFWIDGIDPAEPICNGSLDNPYGYHITTVTQLPGNSTTPGYGEYVFDSGCDKRIFYCYLAAPEVNCDATDETLPQSTFTAGNEVIGYGSSLCNAPALLAYTDPGYVGFAGPAWMLSFSTNVAPITETMTGGCIIGGTATTTAEYNHVISGGIVVGGTATESQYTTPTEQDYMETMIGGVVVGGSAVVSHTQTSYVREIVIPAESVTADFAKFPLSLAVRISEDNIGNTASIFVTDPIGNILPHENRSYRNGILTFVVKTGLSAEDDTTVVLYYGLA